MEYLVINGKVYNCYNQSYDYDSNMYLRVPNKNLRLCDTFSNINYKVKNAYATLENIRKEYKCANEEDLIEIESTCIKCKDESLQNIKKYLNYSSSCFKELLETIKTNNITQPEFVKQYKDCIINFSKLETSVERVNNEVLEELFETDFLQSTIIDKFFQIITFGWYENHSGNVIQQVGNNLKSLQSCFDYIEEFNLG